MSLRASHLLLLDDGLEPGDVIALARTRHPGATRAEHVEVVPRADLSRAESWRLNRNSTLTGPIGIGEAERSALGLGEEIVWAYALSTPRERDAQPPPRWLPDADGLIEAFPNGLPRREELRMIELMIAIAKRLHLGLRLADEPDRGGFALLPDPGLPVDHYVYSSHWLDPAVLLPAVRRVEPGADLPSVVDSAHPEAAEEAEQVLDGYAIEVDLSDISPAAGHIELRVAVAEVLPEAVRHAHGAGDLVEYHVHWMDAEQRRFEPHPAAGFAVLREAVALRVERLTRAVMTAAGGIAIDEGRFLVTAAQLGR